MSKSSAETHLALLRVEYARLQSRFHELQRKFDQLLASTNNNNNDGFASRLINGVAAMFDENSLDGDVDIRFDNGVVKAHKLVLAARSNKWRNLNKGDVIDMSKLSSKLGVCLLRFLYSSELLLAEHNLESSLLQLVRVGHDFAIESLVNECQMRLTARVDASNCIRFLATSEEIGAEELRNFCLQLIVAHWDSYEASDFSELNAELLLQVLRRQTPHYLHLALRLRRDDVVFLILIKNGDNVCNESDNRNQLPLDIALEARNESAADTLLAHGALVNASNAEELTCLHCAIIRGDYWSVKYLLKNQTNVNVKSGKKYHGATAMHLSIAQVDHLNILEALIEAGAKVDCQDDLGQTPLILALKRKNREGLRCLLKAGADVNLADKEQRSPLYFALSVDTENDFECAKLLIEHKADVSATCGSDQNTLLHTLIKSSLSSSSIFLISELNSSSLDAKNSNGETALILSARHNLAEVTKALLERDANPALLTNVSRQSALHEAIAMANDEIVYTLLDKMSNNEQWRNALDVKNADNVTPLALALRMEKENYVHKLIRAGVNVNAIDSDGHSLLHLAIIKGDCNGALLLLNHGADYNLRTFKGESPVHLAITHNQRDVLDALCRLGASINSSNKSSSGKEEDSLLWLAMIQDFELARVLVRYGVDCDNWHRCYESNCHQTLLHRALNENNVELATFLIYSGCDINSPRRPLLTSDKVREQAYSEVCNDQATPLHLCCQWGLGTVAQLLIEQGADVNAQDVEGRTPLHLAILNLDKNIVEMLIDAPGTDLSICDKSAQSPLALAVSCKNNAAAQAILKRQPSAAEQFDSRGRNFLHVAVLKSDLESVLFLLSIKVNVNSPTKDSQALTPILIAVNTGHEMIVRTLILAGASLGARTSSGETALHLACEKGSSQICSILLANGVDYNVVDQDGKNALHVAVKEGHLEAIRTLLTESDIQIDVVNRKGRNVLHTLAVFGQENSAAIFDLLAQHRTLLPIDKCDAEGSSRMSTYQHIYLSSLLLAYVKGQGALCRSLVRAGAVLGTVNAHGTSIFNCKVATKQLLVKLLEHLNAEPGWGQGDTCEECAVKFSIANRKHHCRHCGRLLCAKCSSNEMPIVKFGLQRPVRVCELCATVISGGGSSLV